jgi:hypothetical protein
MSLALSLVIQLAAKPRTRRYPPTNLGKEEEIQEVKEG